MMKDIKTDALALIAQQRYTEAIPLLFRLDKSEIEEWVYCYALGQCYRYTHNLSYAIYFLEKADLLYPTCAEVTYALGSLYELSFQYERAISQFKKVVSLHPNRVAAYNRIGLLYSRKGKLEEALVWYAKALDRIGMLRTVGSNAEPLSEGMQRLRTLGFDSVFPVRLEDSIDIDILEMVVRNNIGVCYYEKRVYSTAKQWFHDTINHLQRNHLSSDEYDAPLVYMDAIEKKEKKLHLLSCSCDRGVS